MYTFTCRDVETAENVRVKFLASYGSLVSAQMGALLIAIGSLLTNLYPLREHVGLHTGELLVKIGKKLTGIRIK